jgi:predicted nucleotidyltransferase
MRLSEDERKALNYALEGVQDKVFLFGSRTFDNKKGGDIDIIVYSNKSSYEISKRIAVRFFTKCESKIDVLVVDPNNKTIEQEAFINEQNLVQIK